MRLPSTRSYFLVESIAFSIALHTSRSHDARIVAHHLHPVAQNGYMLAVDRQHVHVVVVPTGWTTQSAGARPENSMKSLIMCDWSK